MLSMVTALLFAGAMGFWIWAFLDTTARSRADVPDRLRWVVITTVGGPFGAFLWSLRRRDLGPLPPLHSPGAPISHVHVLDAPAVENSGVEVAYAEAAATLMAPGEI